MLLSAKAFKFDLLNIEDYFMGGTVLDQIIILIKYSFISGSRRQMCFVREVIALIF